VCIRAWVGAVVFEAGVEALETLKALKRMRVKSENSGIKNSLVGKGFIYPLQPAEQYPRDESSHHQSVEAN